MAAHVRSAPIHHSTNSPLHQLRLTFRPEWPIVAIMASLPSSAGGPYGLRDIRSLYPAVTENHLRYLEKWGLVRQSNKPRDRREYSFADLTTIKQVASELERGTPLRVVLRSLARGTSRAARAELLRPARDG